MPTVEVKIGVRDYKLVCGAGQEDRLKRLASQVSEKIIKLNKAIANASENVLMVMSSIKLQDELNEAYSELRKIKQLQSSGQIDLLDMQNEEQTVRVSREDIDNLNLRLNKMQEKLQKFIGV
ncbi:MAG: cell division protein ZapA [Alphaproteobacteria bacterium]|jgi:cell division protein ZapA